MIPLRSIASLAILMLCTSCMAAKSLNYAPPEDALPEDASTQEQTRDIAAEPESSRPLSWSDLTRLARANRQQGEFEKANERLSQAAIQVQSLPSTHANRRTVFGLRARLAIELETAGQLEAADQLADELFREAEASPEVGGAALISLALTVSNRSDPPTRMVLYRIALTTAEKEPASRDRMTLALRIASDGQSEGDLPLARRAIDLALSDAKTIGPSERWRIAEIEILKSRIALTQGDLDVAERSATTANQELETIAGSSSSRGVAEATLAEVLSQSGDNKKALIIARGAHARIGRAEPVGPYAQRVILAALARVEARSGDPVAAREHFAAALAIPPIDLRLDAKLIDELNREIQGSEDAIVSPDSPPSSELSSE
jgi:tetratricopeptide (TPR) repeat protein